MKLFQLFKESKVAAGASTYVLDVLEEEQRRKWNAEKWGYFMSRLKSKQQKKVVYLVISVYSTDVTLKRVCLEKSGILCHLL